MLSALLAIALLLSSITCAPMFSRIPARFTAGRTRNIPNFPMPFEVIDGIMSKLKFKSLFIDDPEAKQSPIALNTFAPAIQLSKTKFLRLQNYDRCLMDNWSTMEFTRIYKHQWRMLPKSSYRYVQHTFTGSCGQKGSEHYFNGQQYDGELHIVHEAIDGSDEDAVLAVFLQAGTDGSALKVEAETASLITEYEHPTHIQIDGLTEKLPKSSTTNFMRYKDH
uniref:carbonic anhydrase n=1 Tax=Ditylenchus dipsaci TaxID=166011 RepID=A0A915EF27_9BILA